MNGFTRSRGGGAEKLAPPTEEEAREAFRKAGWAYH